MTYMTLPANCDQWMLTGGPMPVTPGAGVHTGPSQSDPFYAVGPRPGRPVTPGAKLTFHI